MLIVCYFCTVKLKIICIMKKKIMTKDDLRVQRSNDKGWSELEVLMDLNMVFRQNTEKDFQLYCETNSLIYSPSIQLKHHEEITFKY